MAVNRAENQIATGYAAVVGIRQLRLLTLCTGTPY